MITFENGSQDIHVIWPDDYEISHWKCLQPGYNNEQEIEVPERQSIAKWGWWKLRLQKATAADLKHRCEYENCEHWTTKENKKRRTAYIQADTQGPNQKAFERVDVFSVGQNVIREQFSAQTFNTLHIRCALLKLDKIKNELAEGVDQLEYTIRNNEGQDYDW